MAKKNPVKSAMKNKLPVASVNPDMTEGAAKMPSDMKEQERRYRAEDALRDIERAEKHRKNKELMKDVKKYAREKVKTLKSIC